MYRKEVEQELALADVDPRIAKELKIVVEEINTNVSGDKIKNMMYDLVHVVLEMDERLRNLEYKVCGSGYEDLRRQQKSLNRKPRYFRPTD